MNDVELESLLVEAGYQFNPSTGLYESFHTDGSDEVGELTTDQVADILEIPVEDLQRWELEQEPPTESRA